MTVLTEAAHAGEFLLSEANGTRSREKGTLKSGEVVVDGTVLALSGGELIAHDGDVDTDNELVTPVEGIVIGNWDASAAAIVNVPYIARDAEVKNAAMTYTTDANTDTEGGDTSDQTNAIQAALVAKGIIIRDADG